MWERGLLFLSVVLRVKLVNNQRVLRFLSLGNLNVAVARQLLYCSRVCGLSCTAVAMRRAAPVNGQCKRLFVGFLGK